MCAPLEVRVVLVKLSVPEVQVVVVLEYSRGRLTGFQIRFRFVPLKLSHC